MLIRTPQSEDQGPPPERSYGVWRAFGETIIVEGSEPVWEEPGRQAQHLAMVTAPDYETACRLYEDSINDPNSNA